MKIKWIIATIMLLPACAFTEGKDKTSEAILEGVKHPSKAGTYISGDWTYVYGVAAKGSRSERRMGSLFLRGFPVKGHVGSVKDTPFGRLIYWEGHWNSGWINTMTYDKPIFDSKGEVSKDIKRQLHSMRTQKKKQEEQNKAIDSDKK